MIIRLGQLGDARTVPGNVGAYVTTLTPAHHRSRSEKETKSQLLSVSLKIRLGLLLIFAPKRALELIVRSYSRGNTVCTGIQGLEARDAAGHPKMHREASTAKSCQALDVNSANIEKH